jgi:hypothetical protein
MKFDCMGSERISQPTSEESSQKRERFYTSRGKRKLDRLMSGVFFDKWIEMTSRGACSNAMMFRTDPVLRRSCR